MSHPINDAFLESREEQFEAALEAGDYTFAEKIVNELRSLGFDRAAAVLREVLLDIPVTNLNHTISPYA